MNNGGGGNSVSSSGGGSDAGENGGVWGGLIVEGDWLVGSILASIVVHILGF